MALVGCATGGIDPKAPNFNYVFSTGQVRLTCEISCAGTAGANASQQNQFYRAGNWVALAQSVASVGYNNDIGYYYLGAASEGLGYRNAAKIYYQLTSQARFRCSGNLCGGISVPQAAVTRLAAIQNQEVAEAKARAEKESRARAAAKAAAEAKLKDDEAKQSTGNQMLTPLAPGGSAKPQMLSPL